MSVVIQVAAYANGMACPYAGQYLKSYDPNGPEPLGEFTASIDEAKKYPGVREAVAEWQRVREVEPVRPWDGKPNRPLTAFTVSIERAPE